MKTLYTPVYFTASEALRDTRSEDLSDRIEALEHYLIQFRCGILRKETKDYYYTKCLPYRGPYGWEVRVLPPTNIELTMALIQALDFEIVDLEVVKGK